MNGKEWSVGRSDLQCRKLLTDRLSRTNYAKAIRGASDVSQGQ